MAMLPFSLPLCIAGMGRMYVFRGTMAVYVTSASLAKLDSLVGLHIHSSMRYKLVRYEYTPIVLTCNYKTLI